MARKGEKLSDETRAKISAALKGRKLSAEHVDKIQKSKAGYRHSAETRAKMSAAWGDPKERFLLHVRKTRGCWWWEGRVGRHKGYGMCGVHGKSHRVAYELFVGPLIPGHHIHHVCHNRLCVKPDHLVQLSPKQHKEVHSHPERVERHLLKRVS